MTYSTDNDLFLAFGESNIRRWADLNNNSVDSEITARSQWARDNAYDEINSKLATSPYQFPLGGSTYPAQVVRMEAYLAGVLLYESRGITDRGDEGQAVHILMWHRKRVEEFIRDIHARRIVLQNVTLKSGAVPLDQMNTTMDMVSFDDPGGVRPVPLMQDNMIDMGVPAD